MTTAIDSGKVLGIMSSAIYIEAGRYYTVPAAAEQLGCTAGRVRQMIRAGELEAIRIGGRGHIVPAGAIEADLKRKRTRGRPRRKKSR